MTTAQDIQREMKEKYAKWSKQVFNLVKLPDNFITMFEQAIFVVPPAQHLMKTNDIRTVLGKSNDDLTILEVGHMINVIVSAPPSYLYKDLKEYLTEGSFFSSVRDSYNKMVEDKEAQLQYEAKSRMRLL